MSQRLSLHNHINMKSVRNMDMSTTIFQLCATWWHYTSCSPNDPPLVQHYAVLYLLSSAHCLIWPTLSLPRGPCIHHQQRSDWQFVLMAHIPETPSNCIGYPAKSNQCLWHFPHDSNKTEHMIKEPVSVTSGTILCMRPANKRRRYNGTSSLNGWAHTQNYPWT